MIGRDHDLSLSRQARALGISRGGVHDRSRPVSDADLKSMRRTCEPHMEHPFAGSRMPEDLLDAEGREVGRLRITTLMRGMGIEAIRRRPNTSRPAAGHEVSPSLLRNLVVTRPNQVWAMDIACVPMARGFVHLAAVLDRFSRGVLAWRLSITLPADCLASRRWRTRPPATGRRRSAARIRAASPPAPTSSRCRRMPRSPSAWTARAPGATVSPSNGSGGP